MLIKKISSLLIYNGSGKKPYEGTIEISSEGVIEKITKAENNQPSFVIEPSVVNVHTHGVVPNTPLFSSGSAQLTNEQTEKNLQTHLCQGTGTLISVDNFCNEKSLLEIRKQFPVLSIYSLANVNQYALAAAKCVDGTGLTNSPFKHLNRLLNNDLVLGIGEVGSGATYLGGVASYKIIPDIIENITKIRIKTNDAQKIKAALYDLSTLDLKTSEKEVDTTKHLLLDLGIQEDKIKRVVEEITSRLSAGIENEIKSTYYAAKIASNIDVPLLVHMGLPTLRIIEKIAKQPKKLILGHMNHPSIETNKAIKWAKKMKANREKPTYVEISTFDSANAQLQDEIDTFKMFISSGIVDIISTDYGGGNHDCIRDRVIDACLELQLHYWTILPLFTSQPASIFGIKTGLIEEKMPADFLISSKDNMKHIQCVIKNGKIVYGDISENEQLGEHIVFY